VNILSAFKKSETAASKPQKVNPVMLNRAERRRIDRILRREPDVHVLKRCPGRSKPIPKGQYNGYARAEVMHTIRRDMQRARFERRIVQERAA
jgi:hypothetical protein